MKNSNKLLISAAVAGLMTLVSQASFAAATATKGECYGVNACKGTGECGGKGHTCAGSNACKGKGWMTKTEKECKDLKGEFKVHKAHK